MRLFCCFSLIPLLLACPLDPPPTPEPKSRQPLPAIKPELVELDAFWTHLAPLPDPQLVVTLQTKPGWHIYWSHPGDSGLPTSFRLMRKGQTIDHRVQMLPPERKLSPGQIVTYGYEGWTPFFIQPKGKQVLPMEVTASWLACSETCIKGSKTVTINGPSADLPPPSQRLRQAWQKRPSQKQIQWAYEAGVWYLHRPETQRLELFPHSELQLALEGQETPYCQGNRCRLMLSKRSTEHRKDLNYTLRMTQGQTIVSIDSRLQERQQP